MMTQQVTGFWVEQNYDRRHFMAMFLQQHSTWFLLSLWPVQSPILGHLSNIGLGFHLMEYAVIPVRYWLVTLTGFVPLLYYHILQTAQQFVAGLVLTSLLQLCVEYLVLQLALLHRRLPMGSSSPCLCSVSCVDVFSKGYIDQLSPDCLFGDNSLEHPQSTIQGTTTKLLTFCLFVCLFV